MKKIEVSDLKLSEILNRVPFFKSFSVSERQSFFASALTFLVCKKDRHIIHTGDKETNFYIILSGEASVKVNNDQDEVAQLKPGYFIGEGAFINNRPRSASVIATTDVVVMCLNQNSLRRFPAVIRERIKDLIIEGMAMRLSDMNTKVTKHK